MKKKSKMVVTASGIIAGAALTAGALFLPACNRPVSLSGPPPSNYDPGNNINEDVYGPPPGEYTPQKNMTPTLYGPPATQSVSPEGEAPVDPEGSADSDEE